MSQPIHPGQLKTVNNKLAELGKTMVYQPDMFRSRPELHQADCLLQGVCQLHDSAHADRSIHLATMTPALAEQLHHARNKAKGLGEDQ